VVWTPWAPVGSDTTIVASEGPFHLRSLCPECAVTTRRTIEGGLLYEPGSDHLRVGVAAIGRGRTILVFCADAAKYGSTHHINCTSTYSQPLISFERQSTGEWLRIQ
jgi:hypothetical protein